MEENSITALPQEQEREQTPRKITLSKKTLYFLGGIFLLVIVGIIAFFFLGNKKKSNEILATVNNEPVYTTYLDRELEFYPGTKSADIEKMLTEKVIDDQVTLEAGKKEGFIKEYSTNPSPSTQEYLKRTNQVQDIIKKVNESGNSISGTMVSLWFYNNNYIGQEGLEKGKEIAYAKIKPLYDKVKNGEISIQEAGQLIASDKSLGEIDPSWEVNALSKFTFSQGEKATFWPQFNDLLWDTKEGDITSLHLGRGQDTDGTIIDELYIFGKIDKKIGDKDYSNYEQWLEKRSKNYSIKTQDVLSYVLIIPSSLFSVVSVYANNDDNTFYGPHNEHGNAIWNIQVKSQTGARVPDAEVHLKNGCTSEVFSGGEFGYGPDVRYGCGCNSQVFTTYVPKKVTAQSSPFPFVAFAEEKQKCGQITIKITNYEYQQNHSLECGPPTPTPTPKLVCNKPCTTEADCAGAQDGCPVCLPSTGGTKTCQGAPTPTPLPTVTPIPPTPTPTPPACGAACSGDFACAGARDGCTWCTAGKCSPVVACNTACTTKADCAGVRDGCTECLPNDTGTGSSCKTPPACGTSCTKDSQCAGAKNGCNICSDAGKCTAFNPDMCKCDWMDFSVANGGTTFFPGSDVTFIAFGKVEGANINVATLQSMSFSLYQSTLSNPNKATRIAQSTAITPEVVSTTAEKVRYKVTWNQKIPSTVPSGSLYRVQATIKCVAKPGVLGAATTASATDYYTDLVRSIQGIIRNTKTVLGETTEDNQQAKAFFPGAKISEKSCSIIKYYFD